MANWGTVRGVTIHHTVDPLYTDHDVCRQAAARITANHQAKGYHDDAGNLAIAYNELWCPHLIRVAGRGFKSTNDANGHYEANRTYYAIALLDTNPKPPYWENLLRKRITAVRERWPKAKEVLPHRDVPGASTVCPGDRMARWCRNYVHEEVDDLAILTEDEQRWLQEFVRVNTSGDPNDEILKPVQPSSLRYIVRWFRRLSKIT